MRKVPNAVMMLLVHVEKILTNRVAFLLFVVTIFEDSFCETVICSIQCIFHFLCVIEKFTWLPKNQQTRCDHAFQRKDVRRTQQHPVSKFFF